MKYLMNFLALIVLAAAVWGVIKFRDSRQYDRLARRGEAVGDYVSGFIQARKHNIDLETSGGKRKRPFTFIEQQELLTEMLPQVFGSYGDKQWKQFWDYVYDPVERKEGSFTVKRYRSKEEMQDFLIESYSDPFSYFKGEHWSYFWDIVLGKKNI